MLGSLLASISLGRQWGQQRPEPKPERIIGKAVIWGVQQAKPIINLPSDAIRVRLRMRADKWATAYVRYHNRTEQWVVVPTGNALSAPTWELGWPLGVNETR